jgi:hypothetical protein
MKKNFGNGSGKVEIHHQDMGGWVRVWMDKKATFTDEVPLYLSLSLTEWFRQRPQLRLLFAVPVNEDGNTVELHGWFSLNQFPDISGKKAEPQSKEPH